MSMSPTWPPLLLAGHRFLFLILLLHRMRHSVPLALALSTLEGARQCKGFQSCLAHSQLSVPSDEQSLRHVCVSHCILTVSTRKNLQVLEHPVPGINKNTGLDSCYVKVTPDSKATSTTTSLSAQTSHQPCCATMQLALVPLSEVSSSSGWSSSHDSIVVVIVESLSLSFRHSVSDTDTVNHIPYTDTKSSCNKSPVSMVQKWNNEWMKKYELWIWIWMINLTILTSHDIIWYDMLICCKFATICPVQTVPKPVPTLHCCLTHGMTHGLSQPAFAMWMNNESEFESKL